MARRSDHSRDELRGLALDAARKVVEEEGLRGLSARRVAREIGYAIGTIYNLFANLDDLVDHMNAATLDRIHAACADLDAAAPPDARLRELAQRYIGFAAAHPRLYVTLFEHQRPAGERSPEWYQAKVLGLLGIVEGVIAPVMPGAAPEEVEAQARVLWAGVHGIISLEGARRIGDSQQAGELVELLINNLLAALD